MRALMMAVMVLLPALPAHGQLVSPGRLSAPHEGIRTCTQCHELRQPGIAPARCLSCHEPLAKRITTGIGYHARLRGRDCAQCHKDHLGREATLVRLDRASFRHDSTGYSLRGAHATVSCRSCHNQSMLSAPDVRAYAVKHNVVQRTYLGLGTSCADCHRSDSPHDTVLNQRECSDCHDESAWNPPTFSHERTAYPLTGAHRSVKCAACHERTKGAPRYEGLPHATCTACHADAHRGRLGAVCASCHQTAGWRAVDAARVAARFDHSRTSFTLQGAHARIDCARCHDPAARSTGVRMTFRETAAQATFPRPVATTCAHCHVDAHDGVFRASGGIACTRCHGESSWTPVTFDVPRHARETRYPLRGGHVAVACNACHVPASAGRPPQFRFASVECSACHRNDPHDGRFGARACSTCHADGTFRVERFDHATVGSAECNACHERDDPHGGQFGAQSCGRCHATATFGIPSFDHAQTRFPLEGAHRATQCAGCHTRMNGLIRYRGVPTRCAACHAGRT
jgi:hypothetical protein